jgi:hypothetical protein
MTINLFGATQECTFTRTARADGRILTAELFSCDKRLKTSEGVHKQHKNPAALGVLWFGDSSGDPNVQNPKIYLASFGLNFILLTEGSLPYSF